MITQIDVTNGWCTIGQWSGIVFLSDFRQLGQFFLETDIGRAVFSFYYKISIPKIKIYSTIFLEEMQCRAKLKLHEPRGEAKAKAGKIAAFAKKLNASSCMTFVSATHCSLKFLFLCSKPKFNNKCHQF